MVPNSNNFSKDKITPKLKTEIRLLSISQVRYTESLDTLPLFTRLFFQGMTKLESLWEPHCIHELQKDLEHQIVHIDNFKIYLFGHISKSIWQISSADTFTANHQKLLNIPNVKDGCRSSDKVNHKQKNNNKK
jgi:hypothetical protein